MRSTANAVLCLLAILSICTATSPIAAANEQVADVRIVIKNDGDESIRCISIIAHFLTKKIGTLKKGEKLAIGYALHHDGSLSQGYYKGKAVYIENIRCGSVSNWTKTSSDIPLELLRSKQTNNLFAYCSVVDRVRCLFEDTLR